MTIAKQTAIDRERSKILIGAVGGVILLLVTGPRIHISASAEDS